MTPDTPFLVLGYSRVSTAEQAAHGISLDAQADKIRLYCQIHDLTLLELHTDSASAKSLERPALAAALASLRRGDAHGLVVAKLDRLSRSVGDWNHLVSTHFTKPSGPKLFSVSEHVDTRSAAGRLVLNVLMAVAQAERELIGERTRDALQAKIDRNERCGAVRFGFDLAPDGKSLLANPVESLTIQRIAELHTQRLSLRAICRSLASEQRPTKSGSLEWTPAAVARILKRLPDPPTISTSSSVPI